MITVREALTALFWIILICVVGWIVLIAVIQLLLFMGSIIVPTVS